MAATAPRPNLIWISVEHLRHDTVAALGHPGVRTPNLDRLVAEGTAFTCAYSQSPVCTPSRASFLTGRYPQATRVRQNGQDIPTRETLLPRVLCRHGHDTALFGKMHVCHAFEGIEPRVDDGYRVFEWSHAPLWRFGGAYRDWVLSNGGDYDNLYTSGEVLNSQTCHDGRLHQSTWCFQRAIDFIEREAQHTPFTISINPFAVHDPYQFVPEYYERHRLDDIPPPKVREGEVNTKPAAVAKAQHESGYDLRGYPDTTDRERREMKAAYFATLEQMDAELGRMLDVLERRGERDNTLIVYHGDHGDLLGDHGIFGKGPYLYEGAVRVPLIMSWPDGLSKGKRSDALVELVDLVPTLCELLDVEIPRGVQGRSLVPVMTGQCADSTHRDGVISEHYAGPVGEDAENTGKAITMWRDARYKVIVHHHEPFVELYDLKDDPDEFVNLAQDPAHAALRDRLVSQCFAASVRTSDPLPVRCANF